jgi:hypothetical protein
MARGSKDDLPDDESEIFLPVGLDSRLSVDPSREIRFLAQSADAADCQVAILPV